jgi:hypothetical protein
MSIKDAYKPKVLVIAKLSKEGCIYLAARKKVISSCIKA